jgi:hypothetical protein
MKLLYLVLLLFLSPWFYKFKHSVLEFLIEIKYGMIIHLLHYFISFFDMHVAFHKGEIS